MASLLVDDKRRADVSLGPSWVAEWPVDGGSFGKVSVFLKEDPAGMVTERIVIKDTHFSDVKKSLFWLNKDEFWVSDSRATTVVKKLPVEIVSMYNLRSRIGANSVVGIRNFRLDTPNKMHRLYLEYCSNGDLWELIQSYHRKRTLSRDVGPGLEGPECIPEPFIWHTFECLATAGLLLECGELNADPISAWDLVVHRDFKLANVFLGSNLLDRFRGWPAPKLGDFGLATIIPKTNRRKPEEFYRAGTPGNRAPEQIGVKITGETQLRPLSSKTNVWGVGIVIWSLLEVEEGETNLRWDHVAKGKRDRNEPALSADVRDYYSSELCNLALKCVRFNPDDRPSFREILREIRRNTDEDHTGDLRDALATDSRFKRNWQCKTDRWPLGSQLTPVLGRMPKRRRRDDSDSDDEKPGGDTGAEIAPETTA